MLTCLQNFTPFAKLDIVAKMCTLADLNSVASKGKRLQDVRIPAKEGIFLADHITGKFQKIGVSNSW